MAISRVEARCEDFKLSLSTHNAAANRYRTGGTSGKSQESLHLRFGP